MAKGILTFATCDLKAKIEVKLAAKKLRNASKTLRIRLRLESDMERRGSLKLKIQRLNAIAKDLTAFGFKP